MVFLIKIISEIYYEINYSKINSGISLLLIIVCDFNIRSFKFIAEWTVDQIARMSKMVDLMSHNKDETN